MAASSIEQCHHSDCGFENRLQYCAIDAAAPDGPAQVVAELVDEMLCEPHTMVGSDLNVRTSPEGRTISRRFSGLYTYIESHTLLETTTRISFDYDNKFQRERYTIGIGWLLENIKRQRVAMHAGYSIDIYPSGPVQASLCDTDGSTRRMTDYDYNFLFDHIAELAKIHIS